MRSAFCRCAALHNRFDNVYNLWTYSLTDPTIDLRQKAWYSIDKQIPNISDEVVPMRMTTQCSPRLLFQSRSKQTTMKSNLRGIMLWRKLHYGKPWSLCSPPLCVLPVRWFLRRHDMYRNVITIIHMFRMEALWITAAMPHIVIISTITSVCIDVINATTP